MHDNRNESNLTGDRAADGDTHDRIEQLMENVMATLFVRHNVSDFDQWKMAYDNFDDERKSLGVKSEGVYQTDGNPNDVTVYHNFDTMQAAKAFASSHRLLEVMKNAGVVGAPSIWFTSRV